jgi:N-acetylglucosaminyldiphosphoundecaprenol N-acetyl-beta-D-mannosaminyltransferase
MAIAKIDMGDRTELLGVRISAMPLVGLSAAATAAIADRSRFILACANPHSLVVARSDPLFHQALTSCSEIVADGVGVGVACRLAGLAVPPRVTGFDFFSSMMSELNRRGGRTCFFGSSEAVLGRIRQRVATEYKNVHVDVLSPPFGEWPDAVNESFLRRISDAKPDVLWVGMTAPRQEKWVHTNAARLEVPVIGSVGAVFDYYAGTVHRAPQWYQEHGLEWLYRLCREPNRLWRRTLLSAPLFLSLALWQRVTADR